MIATSVHILRWLGHQLSLPQGESAMATVPARITFHSSSSGAWEDSQRVARSAA